MLSYIDLKNKEIPLWFSLLGGCVGVVFCFLEGRVWTNVIIACVPGILALIFSWLTREVLGYGDGIVLMMIGGMDGYRGSFAVLCLGSFLAAIFCVVLLAIRKVKKHSRIPYVPFLTGAYFLYIGIFK